MKAKINILLNDTIRWTKDISLILPSDEGMKNKNRHPPK
jgi:hypothetical protein